MGHFRFRYASPPTESVWREQLRREVGRWRSTPRAVEWSVEPSGDGWVETLLSQDGVALAYAGKVSLALGGEHLPFFGGRPWTVPDWAATPWTELSWLTRARIWIGPTRT